jgi:hypothetical protein
MIVLTIRPEQEGYCMLIARNGRRVRWADLNADEQKMVRSKLKWLGRFLEDDAPQRGAIQDRL